MPRACNLLRPQVWYRRDCFTRGLTAAGYEVLDAPFEPSRGDVMVIWNRYGTRHHDALKFERAGGTVLVAENGYIGKRGSNPKFALKESRPEEHYCALAVGWHNGRGSWVHTGPERFAALGVELKPWRADGDHIVILPNRAFGVPPAVMPHDWGQTTEARMRLRTRRRVVLRKHPGNNRPQRDLAEDLRGAWLAVVWSSSAGIYALAEGIPVFCEAPFWILKGAASQGTPDAPTLPHDLTRLACFERMASAQWTLGEIETGEPFRLLLSTAGQGAVAAGA